MSLTSTRTGRHFFNDLDMEKEFIQRVNECLTKTDFWDRFQTDCVCLDTELMPWSAKAQALLKDQYASVGAAAGAALPLAENALKLTADLRKESDLSGLINLIKTSYEAFNNDLGSTRRKFQGV